eukprot:CFRG1963T1
MAAQLFDRLRVHVSSAIDNAAEIARLVSSHGGTVVMELDGSTEYLVTNEKRIEQPQQTGLALLNNVRIVSREWVTNSVTSGELAKWSTYHLGCKPIFADVVVALSVPDYNTSVLLWGHLAAYGARCMWKADDATTHIVTTTHNMDMERVSETQLFGTGEDRLPVQADSCKINRKNAYIVTPEWVWQSVKSLRVLNEEDYNPLQVPVNLPNEELESVPLLNSDPAYREIDFEADPRNDSLVFSEDEKDESDHKEPPKDVPIPPASTAPDTYTGSFNFSANLPDIHSDVEDNISIKSSTKDGVCVHDIASSDTAQETTTGRIDSSQLSMKAAAKVISVDDDSISHVGVESSLVSTDVGADIHNRLDIHADIDVDVDVEENMKHMSINEKVSDINVATRTPDERDESIQQETMINCGGESVSYADLPVNNVSERESENADILSVHVIEASSTRHAHPVMSMGAPDSAAEVSVEEIAPLKQRSPSIQTHSQIIKHNIRVIERSECTDASQSATLISACKTPMDRSQSLLGEDVETLNTLAREIELHTPQKKDNDMSSKVNGSTGSSAGRASGRDRKLLSGWVFYCVSNPYTPDTSELIRGHGGEVACKYDAGRVDFVVVNCNEDRSYTNAKLDGVATVTTSFVDEIMMRGFVFAPYHPLHFPSPMHPIAGLKHQRITISGYTYRDRSLIKEMILRVGAHYSGVLQREITATMICKMPYGDKYDRAREWGVPIVSHEWLEEAFRTWSTPETDRFNTLVGEGYAAPHPHALVLPHSRTPNPLTATPSSGSTSVSMSTSKNTRKYEYVDKVKSYPSIPSLMKDTRECVREDVVCHTSRTQSEVDSINISESPSLRERGNESSGVRVDVNVDVGVVVVRQNDKDGQNSGLESGEGEIESESSMPNVMSVLSRKNSQTNSFGQSEMLSKRISSGGYTADVDTEMVMPFQGTYKARSGSARTTKKRERNTSSTTKLTTKRPKKNSVSPVVVLFTALAKSKLPAMEKIVRSLNGQVTNDGMECTHIVAPKVARTIKLLVGLSVCKYVVTPKWLEDSKRYGCFKDEEEYITVDIINERKYGFSLRESLARSAAQKLLIGLSVFITTHVLPEPTQLITVIKSAGGTVMTKRPTTEQLVRNSPFRDSAAVYGAQMWIVIADRKDIIEYEEWMSPDLRIAIYTSEFILSGVIRQQLDFEQNEIT